MLEVSPDRREGHTHAEGAQFSAGGLREISDQGAEEVYPQSARGSW